VRLRVKVRLNGWQRLWILVSVLYLIFVGFFTYVFWPTVETTWHRKEFIERMPADVRQHVSAAFSSQYEADREEREVKAKYPKVEWDGRPQILPNGAVLIVKGDDFQRFNAMMVYSEIISAEVKAQRRVTVGYAALAWLVPCLLLYAFGWVIGWVYRGFRSSRSGRQG
jgi:hypothetical protein